MSAPRGEPTELIYQPKPSWAPALLAAGMAGLVVGLFTWYPYAVIGGAVALFALRGWLVDSVRSIARLPRRQRLSTAPIPLTGVAREKRTEQA
jgi:hypothetical protein